MIYIEFDSTGMVTLQHFMPFDACNGLGKTQAELEMSGALVENIPEPEQQPGKAFSLFYDKTGKTLRYEYTDMQKTDEELKEEAVNEEITNLKLAMAELIETVLSGGTTA